jgi:hypothetical protein
MTETMTTAMVLAKATRTMEAAVQTSAVTLGQKQNGVDITTNLRLRRTRSSIEDATSTPTSTKMAGES